MTRFGSPRAIISDCGGEFVNEKMKSLCESFNIRMYTTAGYSAHQNGINERQHATCDEIIKRMMTDKKYKSMRNALGPAVFAKNIRVGSNGFSPHQVVFGQNPRIPGAIDNDPPAQEGKSEIALIQDRLQAIYSARNALSKVDNAARLNLAAKLTHSGKMVFVKEGEWVWYRVGLEDGWRGPGRVLAWDGKQIFIRHGRSYIIASPSRIRPANPDIDYEEVNNNVPVSQNQNVNITPQIRQSPRLNPQIPDRSRHDSDKSESSSESEADSDEETDNLRYPNYHMKLIYQPEHRGRLHEGHRRQEPHHQHPHRGQVLRVEHREQNFFKKKKEKPIG